MSENERIISEDEIENNELLFQRINTQRDKEKVLRTVREKQAVRQNIEESQREDTIKSWLAIDVQRRLIQAIEDNAESTKDLLRETKRHKRLGKVYGTRFTMTADAPFNHIDFVEGEDDLPSGTVSDTPYRSVWKITIVNEGTGRILFGTNNDRDSNKATASLLSGMTYIIESDRHNIDYLNIRCTTASTIVNIIAEV